MKFFDPSLGVKVTERSYAADCSVNWTTVSGAMDVFVLSHFLGWVIKAMLIRDWLICWVVSIQWELIEILFQHWLPNFAEVRSEQSACADTICGSQVRQVLCVLICVDVLCARTRVYSSVLVGSVDPGRGSVQRPWHLAWVRHRRVFGNEGVQMGQLQGDP